MSSIEKFLKDNKIEEVEILVPDMAGIARGKILPAERFVEGMKKNGLRIPEALFVQTVTGDYPREDTVTDPATSDVYLTPNPETIRIVPWYLEPTAQVICDPSYFDGSPVAISARQVLKRVIALYAENNWKALVAPELEFFLVDVNTDPDYPLEPPIGRSGRRETSRQAYGVDAVNEFDPLFEEIYDFCEAQEIGIDTLIHEAGAAQMEFNFDHGAPLKLADQAFLFKRTMREAAMRHNLYATFMAKPMEDQPGSAMHIHQSVVDIHTGRNVFSDNKGKANDLFFAHIAGLQKYLPAAMSLLTPYVNSYRRIVRFGAAPINLHWGYDNRTVGLRVPHATAKARRVENRVASADANPYIAIAASLACGYLGMIDMLKPTDPLESSAYELPFDLPHDLFEALNLLNQDEALQDVLGNQFTSVYTAIKETEFDTYRRVISPWEREFLLLNV